MVKFAPMFCKFASVHLGIFVISSNQRKTEHTFQKFLVYFFTIICYYKFVTCYTRMPRNRKETLMEHDYIKLKEFYINAIVKMLNNCDDISLIDLIKKLLEKSV